MPSTDAWGSRRILSCHGLNTTHVRHRRKRTKLLVHDGLDRLAIVHHSLIHPVHVRLLQADRKSNGNCAHDPQVAHGRHHAGVPSRELTSPAARTGGPPLRHSSRACFGWHTWMMLGSKLLVGISCIFSTCARGWSSVTKHMQDTHESATLGALGAIPHGRQTWASVSAGTAFFKAATVPFLSWACVVCTGCDARLKAPGVVIGRHRSKACHACRPDCRTAALCKHLLGRSPPISG